MWSGIIFFVNIYKMDSELSVDVDMCHCHDPCRHSVRVGDGRPMTLSAHYIIALQQVLKLPVDPHFNRFIQDPKWTNKIANSRSFVAQVLGLSLSR